MDGWEIEFGHAVEKAPGFLWEIGGKGELWLGWYFAVQDGGEAHHEG